ERYATAGELPVREGVHVTSLEPRPGGGFVLRTPAGPLEAAAVVLATGAYQRPHRPAAAATLPAGLLQLDVPGYRNPAGLPPGPAAASRPPAGALRRPGAGVAGPDRLWRRPVRGRVPARLRVVGSVPGRVRRARLPGPGGGRQHRRPRSVLRRRPFLAQ